MRLQVLGSRFWEGPGLRGLGMGFWDLGAFGASLFVMYLSPRICGGSSVEFVKHKASNLVEVRKKSPQPTLNPEP